MKPGKKKISFKKLGWIALSFLALLSLASSLGYYSLVYHKKQEAATLTNGKHITVVMTTNDITEGKLRPISKANLPKTLSDENVDAEHQEAKVDEQQPEKSTPQKEEAAPAKKSINETPKTSAVPAKKNDSEVSGEQTKTPAVPVNEIQNDKPKIAILISGLGLSKSSTENALTLTPEVTLGFSPYSLDIKQWMGQALKDGHEVFINLPMEAADSPADDPGSFALATNLNADNNLKRLNWVLSRVAGYAGVYSDSGERFTESQSSIRPILQDLKKRNLYFIYGAGYGNESFLKLTKDLSQPTIVSDLVIDTKISASRINENLAALEQSARKNGYALGIGAPYPITIKMLEQWIPTLKEKGIEVVPASVLLKKKESVTTNTNAKIVSN